MEISLNGTSSLSEESPNWGDKVTEDGPQTSAIDIEEETNSLNEPKSRTGWQPYFLRRSTLLPIFIFLLLQIVGLVTLYVFSSQNAGIVPIAAKYHQLWKYGPNAVLAVTTALWVQVELRTKQMATWKPLRPTDGGTSTSLEVEYLSQINITALFYSIKRRHWSVALASLATLLLEAAVIVSTSLLERESRPLSYSIDAVPMTASFSPRVDLRLGSLTREEDYIINYGLVHPAESLTNGTEKWYPFGTTESFCYEPPALPIGGNNAADFQVAGTDSFLTVEVNYLAPRILCNPVLDEFKYSITLENGTGEWTFGGVGSNLSLSTIISERTAVSPNDGLQQWTKLVNITSLTVHSGNRSIIVPNFDLGMEADYIRNGVATHLTMPYQMNCGVGKTEAREYQGWSRRKVDMDELKGNCDDGVLVFVARQFRPEDESSANLTMTVLECLPDDRYGKASLRFKNTSTTNYKPEIMNLNEAPLGSEQPYGNDLFHLVMYMASHSEPPIFTWLRNDITYADPSSTKLAYAGSLIEDMYRTDAIQLCRIVSFTPANATVSGLVNAEISRLTIHVFAFSLLVPLLAITAIICAILILSPKDELPQDPSTLAGTAVLLSNAFLKRDFMYPQRSKLGNMTKEFWQPWGTTRTSMWLTMGALACVIALLEVTYLLSSTKDKALFIIRTDDWAHYAWTLVPSFIVSILKLSVDSMGFNLRILQPYSTLARRDYHGVDALFQDHVFGLLPGRLWRHVTLGSVVLGTMFTPFASIVVGDLFIISGTNPVQEGFTVFQTDDFAEPGSPLYNWTDPSGGIWSPAVAYEIGYYDFMDQVEFATDTFAVPRFQLPQNEDMESATGWVSVSTTAARGKLNCTFVDVLCSVGTFAGPPLHGTVTNISCTERNITVPENLKINDGCRPPATAKVRSWDLCWSPDVPSPSDSDEKTSIFLSNYSSVEQKDFAPKQVILTGAFQGRVGSGGGCPAVLGFGEEVIGDCAASKISVALCNPYLEVGEAEVMFTLPDMSIHSVSVVESSQKSVHIYAMIDWLANWQDFPFKGTDNSSIYHSNNILPQLGLGIFGAITSQTRPDYVTLDDIRGSDAASRNKVVAQLEERWAWQIARLARTDLTTTEGYEVPKPVSAKIINPKKQWLVQNEVSTRILQGLFGAMLFLLGVRFIFGDKNMDKVLPFPPTSVGAMLLLLKGSKILGQPSNGSSAAANAAPPRVTEVILPGTKCLNDKEMRAIFDVPGRIYSLKRREIKSIYDKDARGWAVNSARRNYAYRIDYEEVKESTVGNNWSG